MCIIEDDASRAILGGGEFEHEYEENSIAVFRNIMIEYGKIRKERREKMELEQ